MLSLQLTGHAVTEYDPDAEVEAMSAQAAADEAELDIPEDWEDWRELED